MSLPWERRQQATGLRGLLYRWLYGERRRRAIHEQLARRRDRRS